MFTQSLETRLRVLEDEILRLTQLAAQASSQQDQDNHLLLARDLQREARILRSEIRKLSGSVRVDRESETPSPETPRDTPGSRGSQTHSRIQPFSSVPQII